MMRSSLLLFVLGLIMPAVAFKDISSHSGAGPVEVITVATESGVPDALAARRYAEARRAESAALAAVASTRSRAYRNLEQMLTTERLSAAQLG